MRASILFVLRGRAANLRFSEPVSLEAHGFELAADLALLEGAGHGSHAALQAVLLAIHLLKDLPQLTCLHNTGTATSNCGSNCAIPSCFRGFNVGS